jgi:hypothetical protein
MPSPPERNTTPSCEEGNFPKGREVLDIRDAKPKTETKLRLTPDEAGPFESLGMIGAKSPRRFHTSKRTEESAGRHGHATFDRVTCWMDFPECLHSEKDSRAPTRRRGASGRRSRVS